MPRLMVVKLTDLIADMLTSMERREREQLAEEAGISPDELAQIMAELEKSTPPEEPHH